MRLFTGSGPVSSIAAIFYLRKDYLHSRYYRLIFADLIGWEYFLCKGPQEVVRREKNRMVTVMTRRPMMWSRLFLLARPDVWYPPLINY
jgi:hypothetical protein